MACAVTPEDIGDDLVGGSLVCPWSCSSGAQVQDPSRLEVPLSGERWGADGAVLTEVIGSGQSEAIISNLFNRGNVAIEVAREPRHRLAGYRYASTVASSSQTLGSRVGLRTGIHRGGQAL